MVKRLAILIGLVANVACAQFTLVDPQFIDPIPCSYTCPYLRNVMLEGFDIKLSGYENKGTGIGTSNQWTLFGATSKFNAVRDITNFTTNKPQGSCDQALQCIFGTDGTEACASYDLGYTNDMSTATNILTFNMMIESIPAAGNFVYFFGYDVGSPSLPFLGGFRMQRASATTATVQWTSDGSITLSSGVWYSIKVIFDESTSVNASGFFVWQGDGAKCSNGQCNYVGGGSFTRLAGNMRYLQFGCIFDLDAADNFTLLFDSISFYRVP